MKRAFTLVEIMVVVAIIAILIGISVPSFRAFLDKEPLEKAIADVEGLCRQARAEAIVNQRPMDVILNDVDDTVALVIAPRVVIKPDEMTGVNTQTTEEAREIDRVDLTADLQIIEPEQEEQGLDVHIRFYPNGTSEPLEVRVSSGDGAYRLILDPVTGHTKVANEDP
jgi:prepilin-type N-terminal cleavage/methylation domain-containing protein